MLESCSSNLPIRADNGLQAIGILRSGKPVWPVMGASPDDPSNGDQPPAEPPAVPQPAQPAQPATTPPEPPLHDDPAIAKALEGLSPEQRETLLTTGGRNALAARLQEAKDAKAQAAAAIASAEQARSEMAQQIGKALGLIQENEPVDPAKLTEQLTAAQQQTKQTQTELAVYQAAATTGANPVALLDSRSFLTKIAALEPNDSAGIQAAITEAVTGNPAFAAATTAAATSATGDGVTIPKPNPAQGSSGSGAPSIDDQIAVAKKDGNLRLALHLENQKLLPQGR